MTNQITLPHDAEGRDIPLDTTVLYSKRGQKLYVKGLEFNNYIKGWMFRLIEVNRENGKSCVRIYYPCDVLLTKPTPPDNWKKLLEDLDHASKGGDNAECLYARRDGMEVQCPGCRLEDTESDDLECPYLAYADIAARIRKLRGDE